MQDDRLVSGESGWFFRVRGGNLVGPYTDRDAARQAAEDYRDQCKARVTGQDIWRPWRKPRAVTVTLEEALRPTGT